jgi:hypothetical protein
MAERRPLVIVGSEAVELPVGDTLPGGGSGGGGISWLTIAASGTCAVNTHERVTGAYTRTLPAIAANDFFVIHAQGGSVVISTPHTVKYGTTTVCAPGDTLTLAQGETVYLLANSSSELGIA